MKTCTKCNETKPYSEFRKRSKTKDGCAPWCTPCFRAYERKVWKESSHRRKSNGKKRIERRNKIRQYVFDFLSENPCEQCGESDVRTLTFDHKNRKEKLCNVSEMVSKTCSLKKIDEEISKCRVLCANCHMKHTADQFGWYEGLNKNGV